MKFRSVSVHTIHTAKCAQIILSYKNLEFPQSYQNACFHVTIYRLDLMENIL